MSLCARVESGALDIASGFIPSDIFTEVTNIWRTVVKNKQTLSRDHKINAPGIFENKITEWQSYAVSTETHYIQLLFEIINCVIARIHE